MRLFFLLWSADSLLIVNSLLRLLIVIIVAETNDCKSQICTLSTDQSFGCWAEMCAVGGDSGAEAR